MGILDSITSGPIAGPRKTVLYGTSGVGKTTWASRWPKPLFIQTEKGCNDLDVMRTPLIRSDKELMAVIKEVEDFDGCETVVLDSADWAENLLTQGMRDANFDEDFGKGVVEIGRRVGIMLKGFDKIIERGKNVILLSHAEQRNFTRPNGASWVQYSPKLTKRACAIVCEWSDELLFADHDVSTVSKEVGSKRVSVARDAGSRSLHTTGCATFVAKHRAKGLADRYDLSDLDGYRSVLEGFVS